jgi:hypothetical protein
MRKNLVVCLLLLSGCSVLKQNIAQQTFHSTCFLYGNPDLEVSFFEDHSFVYKMPYVDEITGSWEIRKDTVFLYSDKFVLEDPSLLVDFLNDIPEGFRSPSEYNKYTNLEDYDAFLIRGRKLYPIMKEGITEPCYLQREEK